MPGEQPAMVTAGAMRSQQPHQDETSATIMAKLDSIERNTLLASKQMLTVEDASTFTGFTERSIYELVRKKAFPFYKPNGKNIFIDRDDLVHWMRQNRTSSKEEAEQEAATYTLTGRHAQSTTATKKRAGRGKVEIQG